NSGQSATSPAWSSATSPERPVRGYPRRMPCRVARTLAPILALCAVTVASAVPSPALAAPERVTTTTRSAAPASAAKPGSTTTSTVTSSEAPVPVEASDTPPVGRFLSANQVLEIANRLPRMRAVRAKYPGSYGGAYLKGPIRWQVSYFSKQGKEIGQVIIA